MDKRLLGALDELDKRLSGQGLTLELVICGAFALSLLGFERNTQTLDVDSLQVIESMEVLRVIQEVGEQYGLGPRWLNDQASTVSLPKGIKKRAKAYKRWRSIQSYVVDRSDLIKMKASAFSIRRNETAKDWEDLELLGPTEAEIKAAIEFLKETNAPPVGASKSDLLNFQETIDDLKSLIS